MPPHKVPARYAGYLEPKLQLCDGLPIMMKKNIDFELGIVTGAVGEMVQTIRSDDQLLVKIYRVHSQLRFPGDGITVLISQWEAPIPSSGVGNMRKTRTQFPLRCSLAETDYKAQGHRYFNQVRFD